MSDKKGLIFVVIGAVLILSALSLFLYNRNEDINAGKEAEILLREVRSAIEEKPSPKPAQPSATPDPDSTSPTAEAIDPTLPEVEVLGYNCIGFLTVPAVELELPVISEWDYVRLQTAPCRQFGSSKTDDMVIAAHNYDNHFGRLKYLATGDSVIFTDMDGNVNNYQVSKIVTLDPESVDVVQASGSALVLYTCTKGGATRVTVFCDRVH